MTHASVKPALDRIEKKLDKLLESENTQTDADAAAAIEMDVCDKTKEVMQDD